MSDISNLTEKVYKDRIQLPFHFDTAKMIEEFNFLKQKHLSHYEYYDAIPLRGPAHMIDPSLPFPPPAEDYADGSWTDWLDTNSLKSSPYLLSVIDFFRSNTKVTLVRLLRLAPGQVVKEHTDPTLALEVHKSVVRLTIPMITNDKVTFYLNNTPVPMNPGECWYLKLNDPHRITNYGEEERVNLTIDMIPNEWLRAIIDESQNNE
ncbi:aspartyl/asparaginyl beta-hydroxylase domain-containing protein [Tenacibaculum sp. TC6]|uniref:aspartyl/asparaginyl beta-hydroxylase domain-containing protein n=1 Tax=Tenacibaculum sp. TC6 TaxID=3423223 RepID=UPI003D35ACD9